MEEGTMIPWNVTLGSSMTVLGALLLAGCAREPVQPDRAHSLADGVSRAESLAIMGQFRAAITAALSSSDENSCTLTWAAPDSVRQCGSPVPAVVPRIPWLQHSGQARDPGEIEQREPINIAFGDSAVWAITLTSTGALKCTGTYGRLVGFRDGVQVTQADNVLIEPGDCGADDVAFGVQGQLPLDVHIDSLVVEGVDPWTFEVLGECCGRALLKYTIQFAVACHDTVRTIIAEYVTYRVNLQPTCADFATGGGSAHFQWWELNDDWSNGNPHRPWSMIRQALLDGLEETRTNHDRGGIRLSSGYRCPHGNASIPGSAPNSYHMHGRAADMFSADYPWTKQEFLKLRRAAQNTNPEPIELLDWDHDPISHHLHAAW
jgi:hypothetical protein